MRKRSWIRVALGCSVLVLLILMIYGGLQLVETAVFSDGNDEVVATRTIVRDGIKYYPRKDICVVMLLGVDQQGKVVPSEEPNHGNAVDMVTLLVFDEKDQSMHLLCINRDTMVEMPRLNEHGKQTGTRVAQLALSHTYGHSVEDSCVNTRTAVSNLLHGLTIDYYFAMNMDAVAILNDAVGGVTVTVEDDFSQVDPTIQMGEMTLMGDQALTFVQMRMNVGDQLALTRVERQKAYMRGFVESLKETTAQSSTFAIETYEDISEYVVTDMTTAIVSRLIEDYEDYTLGEIHSLAGENILSGKHYEYYLDQEALDDLVLSLFYDKKR